MAAGSSADMALQDVLDRLVSFYRPEAVYLFGSRARGDDRADSDYDLLVVVPDETPAERLSLVAAYRTVRPAHVAADVFPCRRSVFDRRKGEVGTLPFAAWTEGRRIYGQ